MASKLEKVEKFLQEHYSDREVVAVHFDSMDVEYKNTDGCKWEDEIGPYSVKKVCKSDGCNGTCKSYMAIVTKDGKKTLVLMCFCD